MNVELNDNQQRITKKALNIYSQFGRGNFKPFINAIDDYLDIGINAQANVDFMIISAQQKLGAVAGDSLENEDNINSMVKNSESALAKLDHGNLDFSDEEIQCISNATEQVARIGLGQLHGRDLMMSFFGSNILSTNFFVDIAENFDVAERHIRATNGIYSKNTPSDSKNAWDMHQTFRNYLAWKREPEGSMRTHHDHPLRTGNEPLPVIEGNTAPDDLLENDAKRSKSRRNKPF